MCEKFGFIFYKEKENKTYVYKTLHYFPKDSQKQTELRTKIATFTFGTSVSKKLIKAYLEQKSGTKKDNIQQANQKTNI